MKRANVRQQDFIWMTMLTLSWGGRNKKQKIGETYDYNDII